MEERKERSVKEVANNKTNRFIKDLLLIIVILWPVTDLIFYFLLDFRNSAISNQIIFYIVEICILIFLIKFRFLHKLLRSSYIYHEMYDRNVVYEKNFLSKNSFVKVEPVKNIELLEYLKKTNSCLYAILNKYDNIIIFIVFQDELNKKILYEIVPKGCFKKYYRIVEKG